MSKAIRQRKTRRTSQPARALPDRGAPVGVAGRLRSAADGLLHVQTAAEPVWKYFWPVLVLAFAVRAAVALSGDFVMAPDEIMQYLEQGHRLVFGNGVIHWEFFYGARSWLIPGLIGGVLTLFDAVGLGQPGWYVGGVKLTFCAISLLVPAGMYVFARWHFDEIAARVALLVGAFWYELVGFAHKPLPSFIATALFMALIACVRPSAGKQGTVWLAVFLAVLATAIRIQYAPIALGLLGLFFLCPGPGASRRWAHLLLAAAVFFLAVGVFDALTWNAGLFQSYVNYLSLNFSLPEFGGSPAYQYLWWLALASGGLTVLCMLAAPFDLRRYGFLAALGALILLIHTFMAHHKEYRYVFVVVPLVLLIGADVVARLAARVNKPSRIYGAAGAVFAAVSLTGILNALPHQDAVYESPNTPKDMLVRFIRDHDSAFAAYRYLAGAPDVFGVWEIGRPYHALPGYYYLHRTVPYYDWATGRDNNLYDVKTLLASVSHVVTRDQNLAIPGYVEEKDYGDFRILRREENKTPVRRWSSFTPTVADDGFGKAFRRLYPDAPPSPANSGIRFVEPEQ